MRPISRRSVLNSALAALPLSATGMIPGAHAQGTNLAALASAKGLLFGTAVSDSDLDDPAWTEIVRHECSILVAENSMKWRTMQPRADQYFFDPADKLVEFGQNNGLAVRGHTLVWYRGVPDWYGEILDKSQATEVYIDFIKTSVRRFAGRMHSWDVVNEATEPSDGRRDGLRENAFLKLMGEDYIKIAFEAAAEADPNAMLTYNDYWLPYDWSDEHQRAGDIPRMLERNLSKGAPIHAFGLQGHLWAGRNDFNARGMRQLLNEVADLGLKIMITEMDVRDQKLPSPDRVRDVYVADAYRRFLDVALEQPATIAVLTWGLSDRNTWLSDAFARDDGLPLRVLPYDADLQPKPIVINAFAEAFAAAQNR